jgi:hypothetical protein
MVGFLYSRGTKSFGTPWANPFFHVSILEYNKIISTQRTYTTENSKSTSAQTQQQIHTCSSFCPFVYELLGFRFSLCCTIK